MSKEELINTYLETQSFAVSILQKFEAVSMKVDSMSAEIAIIKESKQNLNPDIEERIRRIEEEHYEMQQYSRRDCIELVGIPDQIQGKSLEFKSIEILESIGVKIPSSEIQACHQMADNKRVIIKFCNCKSAISCLVNRKKLIETNKKDLGFPEETAIFLNESLCPYYRLLFGKCNALRKEKKIKSVWSYNGKVRIRLLDDSEQTILLIKDIPKL